ncbi:MAG: hypothetical protein CXR30_15570 [Geobacter sp.]|nr:MAG: hypothetical protein CXR30_15570 [Geobacter sp.]
MRGGVHRYAAQARPKIDAARGKKHPFRTETKYLQENLASIVPVNGCIRFDAIDLVTLVTCTTLPESIMCTIGTPAINLCQVWRVFEWGQVTDIDNSCGHLESIGDCEFGWSNVEKYQIGVIEAHDVT